MTTAVPKKSRFHRDWRFYRRGFSYLDIAIVVFMIVTISLVLTAKLRLVPR